MGKSLRLVLVGIVLIGACLGGPGAALAAPVAPDAPQSIILLIGDGMGINQLRSAEMYDKEVLNANDMVIDSIKTRAVTTNYAADTEVTDSASAISAIMSGYKYNNGNINILPDGRKTTPITVLARNAGKSIGAVSTTRITHATPAGLYAQILDRDDEASIAAQMVDFKPEVALGGGLSFFTPQATAGSKRKDDRDLVNEMKQASYSYVTNVDELKAVDPAKTDKLLGLFDKSHMAYELDRENVPALAKEPTPADMEAVALKVLEKNPKGFFLMVEGGRIDHACHAHDPKASILDTIAFDRAVKLALDYQTAHPNVLVIVTADHETGGLGLGTGNQYFTDLPALKSVKYSLEYLNGQMTKDVDKDVTAIEDAMGVKMSDDQKAELALFDPASAINKLQPASQQATDAIKMHPDLTDKDIAGSVFSWAHFVLADMESSSARIGWTSWAHTAQPIITYAVGPSSEMFSGLIDNTDLAKDMAKAFGVTFPEPTAAK
jgi:alkaline phosphatase